MDKDVQIALLRDALRREMADLQESINECHFSEARGRAQHVLDLTVWLSDLEVPF